MDLVPDVNSARYKLTYWLPPLTLEEVIFGVDDEEC